MSSPREAGSSRPMIPPDVVADVSLSLTRLTTHSEEALRALMNTIQAEYTTFTQNLHARVARVLQDHLDSVSEPEPAPVEPTPVEPTKPLPFKSRLPPIPPAPHTMLGSEDKMVKAPAPAPVPAHAHAVPEEDTDPEELPPPSVYRRARPAPAAAAPVVVAKKKPAPAAPLPPAQLPVQPHFCHGTTKAKKPCKKLAKPGPSFPYCDFHAAAAAAANEVEEERARQGAPLSQEFVEDTDTTTDASDREAHGQESDDDHEEENEAPPPRVLKRPASAAPVRPQRPPLSDFVPIPAAKKASTKAAVTASAKAAATARPKGAAAATTKTKTAPTKKRKAPVAKPPPVDASSVYGDEDDRYEEFFGPY